MNLENLVPPLELCKLIPAGEFSDSCFVRCFDDIGTVILCERENEVKTEGWHTIPAPTLQEIIDVLPQGIELYKDSEYFCSLDMCNEYYGETAVIAALKVWLKQKGIEF